MRRSEITALKMLVDALKGTTLEERERIVKWAYWRYVEAPRAERKERER